MGKKANGIVVDRTVNVKITWVHGGQTHSVTVAASAVDGRVRQLRRNPNYSKITVAK